MTVAAWLFVSGGVIMVGIGTFFLFTRPALLPEDLRYLGQTASDIDAAIPPLRRWLRLVFTVLGGYAVATGILTIYLAANEIPDANSSAVAVLAVTGASSLGVMTVVNFLLHSAFRWPLSAAAALWIAACAVSAAS
uniref:Uncharacterized protein n=2 Tax=unclassified Mycobacterium TaxID=2642494 RepID=A0A5Q5BH90_MYCSS